MGGCLESNSPGGWVGVGSPLSLISLFRSSRREVNLHYGPTAVGPHSSSGQISTRSHDDALPVLRRTICINKVVF